MKNLIKSDLGTFIKNIDKLRNLVRYQSAPRVYSETVAEHSFFVSAYVLKLYDYYNFDLQKALHLALLHDYAEVFISDVPHPIKESFPKLKQELENAEIEIVKEHLSEEFSTMINEFNNNTSPEGIIVNMADVLSVISYSSYEINLGNSEYMNHVYKKAFERLSKLINLSQPYLKDSSKNIYPELIDL